MNLTYSKAKLRNDKIWPIRGVGSSKNENKKARERHRQREER